MSVTYPFTEEEMQHASEAWGCNCGPSALAFALRVGLDAVRYAIPGFEQKRYTSPTMMKAALEFFNRKYTAERVPQRPAKGHLAGVDGMFGERMALVRVQWSGPWTEPGANPKWAYWHTHWIATWTERGVPLLFDCNGGIMAMGEWEDNIVPLLATAPKADGGWFPTHIWRLTP